MKTFVVNSWSIARRDFRTYFTSPIAYIVMGGFLGIMGWMFFNHLQHFAMEQFRSQQMNMGRGVSLTDAIIRPLFGNMNVILLFMIPFITMRLFAEEKKNHTLELLMTSPVTLTEIIMGKFFSALLFVIVMLALTSVYPIVLFVTSTPDAGPITASYIGTVLMAASYLAVGILFSSMTENQIVAGSLTFATTLFFWLINWAAMSAGPVWGDVLNYLSLIGHFNNFGQGVLDTSDIVFYLSFTGISLFLTHRILDSYRWR